MHMGAVVLIIKKMHPSQFYKQSSSHTQIILHCQNIALQFCISAIKFVLYSAKFVQAINLINFGFCENYIFVARYYSCYCIHNRNFCDYKKTIACNCKICFAIMIIKSNSYNAMVQ